MLYDENYTHDLQHPDTPADFKVVPDPITGEQVAAVLLAYYRWLYARPDYTPESAIQFAEIVAATTKQLEKDNDT